MYSFSYLVLGSNEWLGKYVVRYAGMGIELASEMINCLLFADDIVLIGKTEEELQSLLTIAGIFPSK